MSFRKKQHFLAALWKATRKGLQHVFTSKLEPVLEQPCPFSPDLGAGGAGLAQKSEAPHETKEKTSSFLQGPGWLNSAEGLH